jgi:serine/threonine protein kinase, bacterial
VRSDGGAFTEADGASTVDLSGRFVGSSYLLVRPIGQGATGTVWRGVDQKTSEPVAIKLLHASLLRQPKSVTRFVQERTILLMLRHRNVVRVRDLFSVGETLGLVMDLVAGGSLRDHLRAEHTVPAGEAARLAAQVAAALAEAHDLGIVHRDLKPDNVLLRLDGGRPDTRLTDFGIARILNAPSMTTANAIVGTPHYMAPEAFHGTTASPATDIYALGVLLYELVSGRPPYDSDSIPDLMRLHMDGDPPRRPGIPDPLWDLIMECMALKPRLRPSAVELVTELSDLVRPLGRVPALPPPEDRSRVDLGASDAYEEGLHLRPARSGRPPIQNRGRHEDGEPVQSWTIDPIPPVQRAGQGRAAGWGGAAQGRAVPLSPGDGHGGGGLGIGETGNGGFGEVGYDSRDVGGGRGRREQSGPSSGGRLAGAIYFPNGVGQGWAGLSGYGSPSSGGPPGSVGWYSGADRQRNHDNHDEAPSLIPLPRRTDVGDGRPPRWRWGRAGVIVALIIAAAVVCAVVTVAWRYGLGDGPGAPKTAATHAEADIGRAGTSGKS